MQLNLENDIGNKILPSVSNLVIFVGLLVIVYLLYGAKKSGKNIIKCIAFGVIGYIISELVGKVVADTMYSMYSILNVYSIVRMIYTVLHLVGITLGILIAKRN